MLKEFKTFLMRGNVMDLAVGVVIGAAFGKVVSSLVEDLFNPLIGMVLGKVDFSKMKVVLSPEALGADGKVSAAEVAIRYGNFLNSILQFVIVGFCIFVVVKAVNKFQKPGEEVAAGPTQLDVLEEIRDLMKAK